MGKKKEDELTFEDFCAIHLECLDDIKALATTADEGQPQPFCSNDVSAAEEILSRVLTACWNNSIESEGDDTEEIETDTDEEVEEENGEETEEEETA